MGLKDDLLKNLGAENNNVNNEPLPWEIEGVSNNSNFFDNQTKEVDIENNRISNILPKTTADRTGRSILGKVLNGDSKKNKLLLGITAILIFFACFAIYNYFSSQKTMTISHGAEDSNNTATAEITIHIGGAVNKPGVYKLNCTQRLMDAVNAAGGLSENADSDQVNLAKVLEDGEQIIIPSKTSDASDSSTTTNDTSSSSSQNGKININTADLTQLQTLSGVGPSTAQKIIDYRNSNGKFKTIDDLKKVSGIGEKTFAKFSDKICA